MINFKKLQKEIIDNKIAKGFNITDIPMEFRYTRGELDEAEQAYKKKLPDLGEELADVIIYLLGMAEILKIDLEKEIINKIDKNKKREYKKINGKMKRTKEA
ncbi:hypothetical protein KKG41_03995 [Patescibacteria group bacterium]|nr:hypothetical protein [Patescibacteria group bacterium]MBU1891038.1 hypothetical protein [Patescibacteria group bacterium]